MIDNKTISRLKEAFGMITLLKPVDKRKKEIEAIIFKGNLKTKTEVAKKLNLCDSYVCRILKHKK